MTTATTTTEATTIPTADLSSVTVAPDRQRGDRRERSVEAHRLTAIASRYNERIEVVSARPHRGHRRYWVAA